jgi:methyl-accepting chemotaxis protein
MNFVKAQRIESVRASVVTPVHKKSGLWQSMLGKLNGNGAGQVEEKKDVINAMAMMENIPVNVLYADLDFKITYANSASANTLKKLEQYLPVKVEALVGESMDIFHKNPQHQRRMLSDPRNLPHQATIQLGPEKLDLLVSAVHDADGNYIGPMVTWTVATEKLRIQSEMARVTSMMENAPINVLYADKDLRLTYANPASVNTLKTVEQYLPVRVDTLVGQSIDLFHKNPQLQRRILSDPRNLPHKAVIQLGPETLDLLVSAVYDQEQNHMGTMVTWSVITERLAMEKRQVELHAREQEQTDELKRKVDSMLDVVNAAAKGDLTREITVRGQDAIGQMGEGLAGFFTNLRKSIGSIGLNAQTLASSSEEMTSVSHQMAANAEETSAQSSVVSGASEQVSKNIETVATGAEEMGISIREIAKNANEAAKVAASAVQAAQITNATITKLGESSAEIGEVVKVITSIAEQTNLLALNATIEAARAGEAGKGFAVVANEVKELSKETSRATENISKKVQAIQGDTRSAIDAIGRISEVINRINDIASSIAGAVEEQTATTAEMGRNVSDASRGVQEITRNIASVAEAAQSGSSGALDSQKASQELARMASELQTLVAQFKY